MTYTRQQIVNFLVNEWANKASSPFRSPLDNSHDMLLQAARLLSEEAVPGGTACQSAEHAVPETTTNDAQRD